MRNPIHVLRSLESKAREQGYIYKRLYRNLYNPEFYWLAYKKIASSQGSMTAGIDGTTIDDMSETRVQRIIATLKEHSYCPKPARRMYIEKRNNQQKKRPLGILSANDKLVQEVIRMLLEAIYEPAFSENSHGFRPKRSCHTALADIHHNFTGVKWMIEGDIKACFDSFDHHVLINLLRKRIHDEQFISLVWKFLKAGYTEQWVLHTTYSGTPQGSGMSPILANIYLSELDIFMEQCKKSFEIKLDGCRKVNAAYSKVDYAFKSTKAKLSSVTCDNKMRPQLVKDMKLWQLQRRNVHYYPTKDVTFKKLQYNRYADDLLVGIIGSKDDAERIKQEIKVFLSDKLKLTLSEEKTKVTHSSEMVRYLGYDVSVSRCSDAKRDKNGVLKRSHYGSVSLYLPYEKWVGKLQEYKAFMIVYDQGNDREVWKPLHRGQLQNRSDVEIIRKYNSEILGIYNFYRFASNVSVLNQFDFIMNGSMHKTFAFKYRTSADKIRKKYMRNGIFGVDYDTRQGIRRCESYKDGFKMKRIPLLNEEDTLPQYRRYDFPNSLAARIKKGLCELCGAQTGNIRMNHVRRLKDLQGISPSERMMIQIRRRSLALCSPCFEKVRVGLL